jgi:hypothetical protein
MEINEKREKKDFNVCFNVKLLTTADATTRVMQTTAAKAKERILWAAESGIKTKVVT